MIDKHYRVRLTTQWGHRTYSTKEGDLQAGLLVSVEFPDGTTGVAGIQGERIGGSVPDHGADYHYVTTKLFITADLHGLDMRVPLERLSVRLMQEDDCE